MKNLILTKDMKEKALKKVIEAFKKDLEKYEFNMNENKFNISYDFSTVAKEKVTILYTQQAYLRMLALVRYYDTEVGWYGLVSKLEDKKYLIYDVKVCKQYVNGGKVDTDDEETLEFFNSLTDNEAEDMRFQGHSHVKMSTEASGVDLQNQADVIRNMGKTGFYIFQIWNKGGDVNTYLYDLDNNLFYDKKDVQLEIMDEDSTLSEFIESTKELVQEKKYYPYYYPQQNMKLKNKGKRQDYGYNDSVYLNGYWDGNSTTGRWDW